MSDKLDLKKHIRDVEDFPIPGIKFRDITSLIETPEPFRKTCKELTKMTENFNADLIVNTTPVGMKTASNQINILPYGETFWRSLNSKTIVYDLIYNPAPTHLLKFSANKGCMTIDGLQMLVAQGLKSLSIWTKGLEVPFHIMNDALKNYL